MPNIIIYIALFILGASIGSFINVLIYRIYRDDFKSILTGRSQCPACNKKLSALELIPLISYLILKGKCRSCKKEIHSHYFIVELVTALTFILLYSSYSYPLINSLNISYLALILFYFSVLIFTFFYDLKYMEVADSIMLPSIFIALIATIHPYSPTLKSALIGAGIIFSFFYLQILISNGKWLGGGDLRIGVLMGFILGMQNSIVALIATYLIGSLMSIMLISLKKGKLKSAIPFAPFLCIGTLIAYLYGNSLTQWYLNSLLGLNI